jgi:hypothetical protein
MALEGMWGRSFYLSENLILQNYVYRIISAIFGGGADTDTETP